MERGRQKLLLQILIALGILAVVTSFYLTYNHYSSSASLCDFGENISCSLVNSSTYSEFLHVPVALFGALWAGVLSLLAWWALKKDEYIYGLLVWSILGTLSVFYFVYAEFVLGSICPFCTLVHVITLTSLAISYSLYKSEKGLNWEKFWKVGKGVVVLTVIVALLLLLYFNIKGSDSGEDYTSFATCLRDNGVQMYGSYTCGHCATQRAMFGDAFEIIGEVECNPNSPEADTELCLAKEITGTPTWIREVDGVEVGRLRGSQELEALAEFSGCSLVEEVVV